MAHLLACVRITALTLCVILLCPEPGTAASQDGTPATPPPATAGATQPLAPLLQMLPPPAPDSPAGVVTRWIASLRHNDLHDLYLSLSTHQKDALTHQWLLRAATPDPTMDAKVSAALLMLQTPAAMQVLMAQILPVVTSLNPQELIADLRQAQGFLLLAGGRAPDSGAPSLDYAALQAFTQDIINWLPDAGLNDPAKARKVADHLIIGIQKLGVKNAADIRVLHIDELATRLGPALAEIKAAVKTYGLDADALLDSCVVTALPDKAGQPASVSVAFTSFAHPHMLVIKMVKQDETWSLAEGKDSPFAGISQLIMLGMMMATLQGPDTPADGGAPPAPAQGGPGGGNPPARTPAPGQPL